MASWRLRLKRANEKRDDQNRAMLSELDFTEGDGEAVRCTKQLEICERELGRLREEYALWEGRQSARGSEAELKERLEELFGEHERLTYEYNALTLALETIGEAGTEIQNRMTPELSRRAAAFFSRLTGGKYDAVLLDKELSASAKTGNDSVARESAFLSVGGRPALSCGQTCGMLSLRCPRKNGPPVILERRAGEF